MDIQTISASLTSLGTAVKIMKGIASINKDAEINLKVIELQSVILNLQSSLLFIQSGFSDLIRENEILKDKISLKGKMNFKKPFWYMENDQIPFCPHCWESQGKSIHLTSYRRDEGIAYDCKHCNTHYYPYEM